MFRGVIVPEPEIPFVINNPTFDVESNQEIRETIISTDEDENDFYVSYISLKGSGIIFKLLF